VTLLLIAARAVHRSVAEYPDPCRPIRLRCVGHPGLQAEQSGTLRPSRGSWLTCYSSKDPIEASTRFIAAPLRSPSPSRWFRRCQLYVPVAGVLTSKLQVPVARSGEIPRPVTVSAYFPGGKQTRTVLALVPRCGGALRLGSEFATARCSCHCFGRWGLRPVPRTGWWLAPSGGARHHKRESAAAIFDASRMRQRTAQSRVTTSRRSRRDFRSPRSSCFQ